MFSWTIDGKEYTAPMGYGEITIERYATYMATVTSAQRAMQPPKAPKKKGFMARLTRKINKATEAIKAKAEDPIEKWEHEYQAKADFVAFWLKCEDVIERIDPSTVLQIWTFLNHQWGAWEPEYVGHFMHDGKLWFVDYSFDTLASVKEFTDLQVVMSKVCFCHGENPSPRDFGNLSLNIAASIMHEINQVYKPYGQVVGASILQHFNLDINGNKGK